MDELITPLFAPDNEPGPRYQVHGAAPLMERPGLSEEKAANQIRRFAQARWIHVRGKTGSGPTAANTFAVSDVAAAIVISAVLDAGVADRTVLGHASVGLYAWQNEQSENSKTARHPITAALFGTARGEWWFFHIRILRHDQTGQRMICGYCYSDADPPEFIRDPRSPFIPETSISVNLRPLLLPLVTRALSQPHSH